MWRVDIEPLLNWGPFAELKQITKRSKPHVSLVRQLIEGLLFSVVVFRTFPLVNVDTAI